MRRKHLNWFALLVAAWTIVLGVVLLWTGTKNLISGVETYTDSWFFVLVGCICLTWYLTGPRELVVMRRIQRMTWKKAAKAFQFIRGLIPAAVARIRSLAGLFTLPSNDNLQTEP